MNDNHTDKIVTFIRDDGRRVYATPATLVVSCTLYVLAKSPDHAASLVRRIDLEDYFTFDTTSLTTDGESLLKINDILATPLSVVDLTELTTEQYPPNTHPDFAGVKER